MIALIVRHLLTDAHQSFGGIPSRVVVGRPVHFANGRDDSEDQFALARLLTAVKQCGFEDIVFEYEPVAAAYSYERGLEHDELILIGDFGGGTSDFSLLHVGPSIKRRGRTKDDILGSDGVAIAGDAFDRQIIRKLVAPRLGLGSEYLVPSQQVPADAQLALRSAGTLAPRVVHEQRGEYRQAGAAATARVDS